MSQFLLIDTASPCSTVAVYIHGDIHSLATDRERQAAQRVLPLANQLLLDNDVDIGDLDALAVINGPGSFTGMRIGVGVAQGLALAAGIPVLPISTLAGLAVSAAARHGPRHWLLLQLARDDEMYVAAYEVTAEGDINTLLREQVLRAAKLTELLGNLPEADDWGVAGTGLAHPDFPDLLQGGQQLPRSFSQVIANPELSLAPLFRLVQTQFDQGRALPPEQALPNYVKEQLDY